MSIRWGQSREDVQCYELFAGIALRIHALSGARDRKTVAELIEK